MDTILPNGIEILSDNTILGTSKNEYIYLDMYTRFLNPEINSIKINLKDGNDNFDSGNLFNMGTEFSQLTSVDMRGGAGNDFFVGRVGGLTRISGGSGYDEVLTDLGDLITLDYSFTVSETEITFVHKLPQDETEENTKLIISRDVEMMKDFGENYLLVEDLVNGKINYLNAGEARKYRESYKQGSAETNEENPDSIFLDELEPVIDPATAEPDPTPGEESAGVKKVIINNNITNITNNVTTTNISNTGSGNINIGDIGVVNNSTNIDNSFTIQTTNINLSVAITGDSKKSEKVEGTDGDDLIADGRGKDKLIGGEGADQFYFSGEEPFKKKMVDKIIDFDASEGDAIVIADEVVGDLAEDPTMAIAETKKDLRELSKDGYDLLYFEPKGDLYVDGNGGSKGFGQKSEGGMIADLPNGTSLSESDVLIGV